MAQVGARPALRLDMESIFNSGGMRKEKVSVFTPLLDDSDDFALNLLSPNVFGMNNKPSLSPHHEEVMPSATKRSKQTVFNGPLDESLLASPSPGVQYELLYDPEVTPIKRDLFGCPAPSDESDSEGSVKSEPQLSPNTIHDYNLKQYQVAPNKIKCPSCKNVFDTTRFGKPGKSVLDVRAVHSHFNACLAYKEAVSSAAPKKPAQTDKQVEADIALNVARVRKAICKFGLQDRLQVMESLYRLGKTAESKTYEPQGDSAMLYAEASTPAVNENLDAADQQVLSLLYSNPTDYSPASSPKHAQPSFSVNIQGAEVSTPMGVAPTAVSSTRKKRKSPSSLSVKSPTDKHRRISSVGATPTVDMMVSIFGPRNQQNHW